MKRILVLCTGNSCRSQMAEGFLKLFGYNVQSAGIESHGINKYAVKVMSELNIDISNNKSKSIENINLYDFNLLITVCDHAKETCPNINFFKDKIHKSFIDPVNFKGSSDEKLVIYRKVRDEIKLFCDQINLNFHGKK